MADDDDNLQLSELEAETSESMPEGEGVGDPMDMMDDMESGLPQGAQDLEAV